jgi:hypothetical protein
MRYSWLDLLFGVAAFILLIPLLTHIAELVLAALPAWPWLSFGLLAARNAVLTAWHIVR